MTDPCCIYDAETQRFFVVVLTLDPQVPGPCQGVFSCVNHLDLAVSQTSNPTGSWNIYRIDVTNDGTNTGGVNPGPYLGDYPHIGADANGIYLTTNAYPWARQRLLGRADLCALEGAARRRCRERDDAAHRHVGHGQRTERAGPTQPGFTVWPAQSPGARLVQTDNGGTEYFLSSNAADEATQPDAGTGGDYVEPTSSSGP